MLSEGNFLDYTWYREVQRLLCLCIFGDKGGVGSSTPVNYDLGLTDEMTQCDLSYHFSSTMTK